MEGGSNTIDRRKPMQFQEEIEMPGTPVMSRAGTRPGVLVTDGEGPDEGGYEFGRFQRQTTIHRQAGSPAVRTDDVDGERIGTILMPNANQSTVRARAARMEKRSEPSTHPPQQREVQAAIVPKRQQGGFWQTVERVWQSRTWKGKLALIVGAAFLAYFLVAMLYDGVWQAARHWQYGTYPTDQVSVVTGQGDSGLAPTQIQATSMHGQIQITIVPASNLKNTVILAGPIVSWDNPIITLTPEVINGGQSKIEVQILTPPNLLNWNPAPITCYIQATGKGYTLVRA